MAVPAVPETTPPAGGGPPERYKAADGSGRRVCGAKNRGAGRPQFCQQRPVRGSERCRMHGGRSPRGAASPSFKTGMYSKYLPLEVAQRYEAATQDPELLSARHSIALLEARLVSVLKRLQGAETGTAWGDLQAAFNELGAGIRSGDVDLTMEAYRNMGAAIRRGADEGEVWREVREILKEKLDAQGREWRRLVDMKQLITAERAQSLVQAIMHSVLRNVADPAARANISNDLLALTHSHTATRGRPEEEIPA
jgi:hypothetical protein